jgi:organic hydroperoxide reductase OsmC/OhrA
MIQYPIEFNSKTQSKNGIQSNWKTVSQFNQSEVSIPPEFLGPGGALSPEDLFNHALTNCFVATFKVYAENSRLSFADLKVESKLVVDLDENKKPVMKEFFLTAKIITPSNPQKALTIAKKASEGGFILNSVKTICHFNFEVI